jgi:ankyrin repeat protein
MASNIALEDIIGNLKTNFKLSKPTDDMDDLGEIFMDILVDIKSNNKHNSSHTDTPETRIAEEFPFWKVILRPDGDGDNLLIVAILLDFTQVALMMVDLIHDYKLLSRHNKLFQTPLHIAALNDNLKIARRLMIGGIKIDAQDCKGNTPLHIACRKGFVSIVQTLLTPVKYSETLINSYEIPYQPIPQNLEIRNSDGLTCFLLATIYRHKEVMDLLLENEADVNAYEMKSGKTSLHILAETGDLELLKFLTSKPRLKLDARTYAGFTAIKIAQYRDHTYTEYFLRCVGAVFDDSDSESDSG